MNAPLMPKATAVWLIENTTLTFDQVADFCGMHALEVQGIADGEVAIGIVGLDPVANNQLTREEILRCEGDASVRLRAAASAMPMPRGRTKGSRYTPVSKRQDRPDAIAWILRNTPELSEAQVTRLLGTTKATIASVRGRTHWNSPNIKPRSPVSLGLCTQEELDGARTKAQRLSGKKPEAAVKPKAETGEAEAAS